MKISGIVLCMLVAVLISGCALTGGGGSGTSERGVSWSGTQNLQIGNNTGKK